MSSPCKRLSYEKMRKVCDSLTVIEKPYQPYPNDSHWWRTGENDRYAYESNSYSLDHRIIDKKTNYDYRQHRTNQETHFQLW